MIYGINTIVVARTGTSGEGRIARVLFVVELVGVVGVGVTSLVRPGWFADASVWSGFGIGYGLVPLGLPLLGLFWLRKRHDVGHGD